MTPRLPAGSLAAPVPQCLGRQGRQCHGLARVLHLLFPEACPPEARLVLQERRRAACSGNRARAGKSIARVGQCPAQSLAHQAVRGPRAVQFAKSLFHRDRRRARAEWSLAWCLQCRVWLLHTPAQVHALAAGEEPQCEVGGSGLQGCQQVCQCALRGLPHTAARLGPNLEGRTFPPL
ncbi:hypothetical protein E2C01_060873 [Portunus trituberculatus]|uniref:Uncharacterized protein n=1 Tax=Portunus trituberculatus TaxID=210409 RepID=A0A5B7H3R5_PORTR|nr:hypothetical protein [Portunus trituberculatus]